METTNQTHNKTKSIQDAHCWQDAAIIKAKHALYLKCTIPNLHR